MLQSEVSWTPIIKNEQQLGHLSSYYSNNKSDLPIRDVSKRWDQKSDPNLETKTYGLFSTCMPPGRRNIVTRGDSYLFFMTNWRGKRRITGYYELGWYINTGLQARNKKNAWKFPDFALKATRCHFVRQGIELRGQTYGKLPNEVNNEEFILSYGPRNFVKLNEKMTLSIRNVLDKEENLVDQYITEIQKLEEENLKKTGFRYPIWKMKCGFTDELIPNFIKS